MSYDLNSIFALLDPMTVFASGDKVMFQDVSDATGHASGTMKDGTLADLFANAFAITTPSVNKVTITAPATSAVLTLIDGKTFQVSNTLTLAGTDGTTMTFPSTSATIARTDAAQTFTGTQTITPAVNTSAIVVTGASLTGSSAVSFFDYAGTWNTSGTPTAFKLNVTDTASNAASKLMDLQVGGSTKFGVSKAGRLTLGSNGSAADPAITFPTNTNGFSCNVISGNEINVILGGVSEYAFFATLFLANANNGIGWSSTTPLSGSVDLQLSRSAGNLLEVNDGTVGQFADVKVRKHFVDQTITTPGTTGNQTINKAAGTVNIAAAGTTVTVTCDKCTTSSEVYAVLRTNDATARLANVVPGSGSFVINIVACTAEVSLGWEVRN